MTTGRPVPRLAMVLPLLAMVLAALHGSAAAATSASSAPSSPACPALAGKRVQWIVPNRPGGGYDAYSRLLEPFLEARLDAEIVIVNRPEAGGTVGARALSRAAPDGRTLGILNAAGLLVAQHRASGTLRIPHPGRDFTLLGRLVRNQVVLFTAAQGPIDSLPALLAAGERQAVVFAVRDLGSTSFFAVPMLAALLGLDYALVTGYVGSSARTLALLRGEVDAIVANYDSVSAPVRAGELRPVLQLGPWPAGPAQSQATGQATDRAIDLPVLTGPDGIAARRAAEVGTRSPEEAVALAGALVDVVGAGRLLAAPANLPPALAACLEGALNAVLADPDFQTAAERRALTVDWTPAASARADLSAADRALERVAPLVTPALERALR